jgi:hypothetical protein
MSNELIAVIEPATKLLSMVQDNCADAGLIGGCLSTKLATGDHMTQLGSTRHIAMRERKQMPSPNTRTLAMLIYRMCEVSSPR